MSFVSKPSEKIYPVLATGLISFCILLIQLFSDFVPGNFIGIPVQSLFSGSLITIFLTVLALSVARFHSKQGFKKASKLLNYPIILSVILLPIVAIPFLILKTELGVNQQVFKIFHALAFFCAVLFVVFIFFNIRKIVLSYSREFYLKSWNWLMVTFAIGTVFNFISFPLLHPVSIIFLGIVAGFLILLLTNFSWIKYLENKDRAKAALKFILTGSAGAIILLLMYSYGNLDVFAPIENLLLFGIFSFVILFAAFAGLAALVSIPIALLKNDEQKLLQDILNIHSGSNSGDNQKDALQQMFFACLKSSGAKGGALIFSPTEASLAEQVLEQEGIGEKDLKRILFSIIYNKEHFLIHNETEYIYIDDIKKHPVLQNHNLPVQSMLIFMVQVKQNAFAKMILLSNQKAGFSTKQISYTSLLVQQAQLSLNNNLLFKDTLEVERFKKDMEIGKNLQKRLLPEYFPENDHFEVSAVSLAAEEVGGDYYDYYQFKDNTYSFIIADVSGKGTPAAFHVAEMKGIFQSLSLSKITPADFVKKANIAVSKCFDRGMFITLIHLTIDVNKNVIKYARAGHCPILFFEYKKGNIAYKQDDGLGLGILRNSSFDKMVHEHEFSYSSGDILVLYTDGLVEAKSRKLNEEYGFDRLKDVILFNSIEKPDMILKKVVKDVQEFAAFDLSRDDVSMVVLKMK